MSEENKDKVVKINTICAKCQHKFIFDVDMIGKTEIRIVCPKCGYRDENLEHDMELLRDE